MSNPAAFQVAFLGNAVLYRVMDKSAYNAYMKGEPADDNTLFTSYDIPNGYEISNMVISTNGDLRINVEHK